MKRPWTREDDAKLLDLRARGLTGARIAAELGRPDSSIFSRLDVLRHRPSQPRPESYARINIKEGGPGERKPRKCLCCGKTFPSAHAGNRLCGSCRGKSVSPFEHRL